MDSMSDYLEWFLMTSEENRTSIGRSVRDIALHYYMGLTGKNEKDAEDIFPRALAANDALAQSALRLAEHEVLH